MLPNMRDWRRAARAGGTWHGTTRAILVRNRGHRRPHVWPASGGEPRSPLTAPSARRIDRMCSGRSAVIEAIKWGAMVSVRAVALGNR